MANKRMFSNSVLETDAFLDLPLSTQALYFHLNMKADDDGFIGNAKRIARNIGASEDDLKLLIAKSFLLIFEDGVIVVKHWRMHNYIQSDRYTPTNFDEDKALLYLKNNKSYTLDSDKGEPLYTKCIQNVSTDKIRIDKNRLDKSSKDKNKVFIPPTVEEVKAYCKEKNKNVDAEMFVNFYESKGWMVGKNKMVSWKSCINTWERKNNTKQQNKESEFAGISAKFANKPQEINEEDYKDMPIF